MPPKDTRVTLKLDRPLWNRIQELIEAHPEWGVVSVPDFIRRAVETEIKSRKEQSARVINLCFAPDSEDTSHKGR